MSRRGFIGIAIAITLLALALRLGYFFSAQVDYPIRGDIAEYFAYAWNLVHHETFSSAPPNSAVWPPDAFRGPGYPMFLALWLWIGGGDRAGYLLAAFMQIVVGALTVPLAIAWSRSWLSRRAALAVGAMVALWPHAIVFSSTLLSETVFGATLLLFLCWAMRAVDDGRRRWAVLAGACGGAAYLINPVALLFPPLAALLMFLRGRREAAVLLLSLQLLVVGGWSLRNATHPQMRGAWDRAAANLVEGSWPLYQAAYNARLDEPVAAEMIAAAGVEKKLFVEKPAEGAKAILSRMGNDPYGFARWYLLQKPYSLWGWRVGIGWGDIYFLQTERSPFERQPVFRAIHGIFYYANPWIFAGAFLAALLALVRPLRDRNPGGHGLTLASLFFLYITFVHTVFQADPRYAVAYRAIEAALAVTAIAMLARALRPGMRDAIPTAASTP